MLFRRKAKEVGANFRSDEFRQCEFSPRRNFGKAKFRFYGMRNFAKMTAKFEIRGRLDEFW